MVLMRMKFSFFWLFLLATIAAISSCATIQVLPEGTGINQANLERYFNDGDQVKVTTVDGEDYKFMISSIEDTYLEGNSVKVPYSVIIQIESYKDYGLPLIGVGLALLVLFVGLGVQ